MYLQYVLHFELPDKSKIPSIGCICWLLKRTIFEKKSSSDGLARNKLKELINRGVFYTFTPDLLHFSHQTAGVDNLRYVLYKVNRLKIIITTQICVKLTD